MTVNKITNAPTPNEQIDKINEIIDNLSSSSITVDSSLSTTSTNPVQNKIINSALSGKYDASNPNGYTSNVGTVTKVNNASPDSSGNVTLSIPTVNNAKLTIQKNGSTVKTFTANASSNVTANITVPTKTSELTNDSGYTTNTGTVTSVNNVSPVNGNVTISIPAAQIQSDWNQTNTSSKDYIKNKPTIPSVGNGTITITQGGTTKGSFTTNQSGNATISLDAGGGTATTVKINGTSITSSGVADIKTNGTYNSSSNKIATMSDLPTVPTNISSFTNDSGYITGINSTDVTTALGYTPANTTLSNLGATSSTNFDGRWVGKYLRIENSTSIDSYSHSLSNYLPDSTNKYEILVETSLSYKDANAGFCVGTVASPDTNKETNDNFFINSYVTSASKYQYVQGIIPIGTGRTLYSQVATGNPKNAIITLTGYRRIGTNS